MALAFREWLVDFGNSGYIAWYHFDGETATIPCSMTSERSRVLIRSNAMVQPVGDYEKAEEEREFMRAVVVGMSDLEEGREVSLDDARTRPGLK